MIEINSISECIDYLQDIDLVLFDLDDTLTNEIDYVKSGFDAIANEFPSITNCSEKLMAAFENTEKPINKVLEDAGMLTEANVKKAIDIYRNHKPDTKFIPGAQECLITLRKQGKKLGVITDGRPEGQRAKIEALKLGKFVDKIIITDELGGIEFRKPNPKAYELMQEFFHVSFEKMAYVGDNAKKDFIAPEKLGMKSVYLINKVGLYR